MRLDVTVSIVDDPCNVVVVTAYVPGHAAFRIGNGNEIELDVPDLIVNIGVVNRVSLAWLQFFPIGPDRANFTFTFCGALTQSMILAAIVTNAGRVTDNGLTVTAA